MSISTSMPQITHRRLSHRLVVGAVVAAITGVIAWAIATYAVGPGARPASPGAPTHAWLRSGLTAQQRQYVLGIAALPPAQLSAAFGDDRDSSHGFESLTPKQHRSVQAARP